VGISIVDGVLIVALFVLAGGVVAFGRERFTNGHINGLPPALTIKKQLSTCQSENVQLRDDLRVANQQIETWKTVAVHQKDVIELLAKELRSGKEPE
jgi:hypothetical protein